MPLVPFLASLLTLVVFAICSALVSPAPSVGITGVTSIDVLSALAAFATAIAIAYASLPNFRHRKNIQEYTREAVTRKEHNLLATLKDQAAAWNNESGAILFTLGKLAEINPTGTPPFVGNGFDRNFRDRQDFKRFSWVYSSNLDKIVSVVLGALASTVLLFGARDHIDYPNPDDLALAARSDFIGGIVSFYCTNVTLIILAIIIHGGLWKWDMTKQDNAHKWIERAMWYVAYIFVMTLLLASVGLMPLYSHVCVFSKTHVFAILEIVILLAIGGPIWLLWEAERLTATMKTEVDTCIQNITNRLPNAAENVTLTPTAEGN